ncbi:MAG: DUF192 domain-containing protein [Thioalkalivibrio sp.]|nr:DUF192 domain-containing protein [Thioalkalivibrio sp.]
MPRDGTTASPRSRCRWFPAVVAVLLLGFASGGTRAEIPNGELRVADQTLAVEIAATPQAMARGLMFRRHMPEDEGMLFIWPGDQVVAMWMKNTLIPLSVAFIDRDFQILNIADMEPGSLRTHPSHGPARYALEVNKGWFSRHGVEAGTRIDDLERLVTDLAGRRH